MRFTITETGPESESHKKTHNASRSQWRKDNPAATRYENVATTFIAIDGEGISLPDGTHRYVLLGVGDQQITNPNGLEFEEICDFLWEQFLEHGTKSVAYVGFFLGYDFIQWLRKLPEERARMLLTAEGKAKRKPKNDKRIQPFPVRYGEWEFDMLGTKRFRLRKEGSKRWMNICDTGPFFQKSFIKVIDPKEWSDPIVSQEEYDTIVLGKANRASASLDRDMLRYNKLENAILPRVMSQLNSGFQQLGIHLRPGQWFGPGQAAQAWLDGRAITNERLREITPSEVLEAAIKSYFGGWFEIMAHGRIPGITYEYDINSAYPYVISQLPCLEHGEWVHRDHKTQWESGYTLVYARVHGDNPNIGAMLHRDAHGNIMRPHATEGWYWLHEIHAAKKAGLISTDPEIWDWWTYRPCECPAPLREVRDIYALRKKVGKKTPLGIACKLVPNSLYGKFAQSVGNPKFANPIYASLITAGCRTMILNAIATHPKGAEDVVMVATDGIYFRSPHPTLPVSGELGDWDGDEKEKLCLFKPGVYWDESARRDIQKGSYPVFKARGINSRDFGKHLKRIEDMFSIMGALSEDWPKIRFPVGFAMITASQALQRNDWSLAGTLIQNPTLVQSADPHLKRENPRLVYSGRGNVKIWVSSPKKNDPYEPSHPYEKRFGIEDPFDLENESRITEDGYVGDVAWEMLGRH